jgi:hypothetical protein
MFGFLEGGVFIDYLSDYKLLKKSEQSNYLLGWIKGGHFLPAGWQASGVARYFRTVLEYSGMCFLCQQRSGSFVLLTGLTGKAVRDWKHFPNMF